MPKHYTGDPTKLAWRHASRGEAGGVEIAVDGGLILLRHLKDKEEPDSILVYTPAEWKAFIGGVKDGEFDDLVN